MSKKRNKRDFKEVTDEQLEEIETNELPDLLEKWDIVTCELCGEDISMLNARFVKQGSLEFWKCRNGCQLR